MSKSCSASAAGRRTPRQSGAGSSATVPNWRNGCAVISSQPTSLGVSMRPTFVSRVAGATSTEPSIPPKPRRLRALGVARCRGGPTPVAGEILITPSKRAFWRNGSASLISRIAAIHSDRDARWRPGRPSLPLHRSCRGDREPFGWDRACSWNRTEVRNRRFPSCSAVGRGSIGQ